MGGALSSFGVSFGADGNEFNSKIEYATFGVSADEFIAKHDLQILIISKSMLMASNIWSWLAQKRLFYLQNLF